MFILDISDKPQEDVTFSVVIGIKSETTSEDDSLRIFTVDVC